MGEYPVDLVNEGGDFASKIRLKLKAGKKKEAERSAPVSLASKSKSTASNCDTPDLESFVVKFSKLPRDEQLRKVTDSSTTIGKFKVLRFIP